MEVLEDNRPKCKRVRTNPTKKWTQSEEKTLIEFLMANRDFEKPTAQSYYKRFSVENKVEAEWKLARAKVRNMRTSYNKAKGWEGSTGAGTMYGETLRVALLKMCTYFFELDDIFGGRLVESAIIEDSLEPLTIEILDYTNPDIEESLSSNGLSKENENVSSTNRKGIYSRTALSDIKGIQSEMLNFRREKADKEHNLKEQELALKEREIELREKEITSNENLKIMELKMRERLAMEELKLKYKQ